MPRYYFDVDIQDVSSVSDTEGMELQSLAEAKAEALSGMAQRFVPSVPEMSIHVRDETGRDVLRIRLSLVVEEIPE
jgi:hypothetical protein